MAKKKKGKPTQLKSGLKNRKGMIDFLRKSIMNQAMTRMALARQVAGDTEMHDIDAECGYPDEISPELASKMLSRDGISKRVNDIFPDECWAVEPFIYETEKMPKNAQTKFEKSWKSLYDKHGLYQLMHRADAAAGRGRFSALLVGLGGGRKDLSKPVCKVDKDTGDLVAVGGPYKFLYARPLQESQIDISEFEDREDNFRFGLPKFYNMRLADPSSPKSAKPIDTIVHWSRVIHIPDNCESDSVYGHMTIEPVINYLLNIRKILGGSAEGEWKGGFPGFSFEVPPELLAGGGAGDIDTESLKEELGPYFDGLQRYIVTSGLEAKVLQPNVEDPKSFIDVQLQAICITMGIPLRVFTGTEEARLASIQDSESWNKRVHKRQNGQITPRIIRPLVDRLIVLGVLPAPKNNEYFVSWPDLYAVSEKDRAEIAGKLISALSEYVTSGASDLFPPMEFFTRILDFTIEEADEILKASEKEIKRRVAIGAIDKAGRPRPSKEEMQMQKAQMKVTLQRAKGVSQRAKTTNKPRTRAKSTSDRAKSTGKR